MSLLNLHQRPWIKFDVTDRKHRDIYAQYLFQKNWGHAPVRFYLEPGYYDLVTMIEHRLAWYYLSKETKQQLPIKEDSWINC